MFVPKRIGSSALGRWSPWLARINYVARDPKGGGTVKRASLFHSVADCCGQSSKVRRYIDQHSADFQRTAGRSRRRLEHSWTDHVHLAGLRSHSFALSKSEQSSRWWSGARDVNSDSL